MTRSMGDTTDSHYLEIGLRSGLEIHQQLDTEKKLFCRCPVLPYSDDYDARVLRHMRPTLSELGEYDGTALMEFKTRKNIIYRINRRTICTYEIDDTPPFELNRQALEAALEVTMLLNCKLVSEIHVQRKQYLDGSIPAGFQRTTILGVDGWVPFCGRKIDIVQLGLEEDACREVSDEGHERVYLTDRLGIPLIETVTGPDMRTPREVAEVAAILSSVARASEKVRRGIGAARQDVNVSVEGGRRVEIKGVSRIPDIPLLVHNEAFRQVSLLEIRDELAKRGVKKGCFRSETFDVACLLSGTGYVPVAEALAAGGSVEAVLLRGYSGILEHELQPGRSFADEISDRVRVIACLDRLPNILHDGYEGDSLSKAEWESIRRLTDCGSGDSLVLTWGHGEDLRTATQEISIRAEEALDGVIHETRQSFPDGTTGFERILPGPSRMYPDTDLPPIAIGEELIEAVAERMPERPWEREKRYIDAGVPKVPAKQMSTSELRHLYDRAVETTGFSPRELMHFFMSTLSHIRKKAETREIHGGMLIDVLSAVSGAGLPIEAVETVLLSTGTEGGDTAEALRSVRVPDRAELRMTARRILDGKDVSDMTASRLQRWLTGRVRREHGGLPGGAEVLETVRELLAGR